MKINTRFSFWFIWLCVGVTIGSAQAQTRAVWCFNDGGGVAFQPQPQPFKSALSNEPFYDAETQATICDADGRLLCYLEARRPPEVPSRLRDANHRVLPGSEGLEAVGSIANGAVAVPVGGGKYFLFTLSTRGVAPNQRIVLFQHTFDGNTGRLVEKNKMLLDGSLVGKLAAVRHGNGTDWWLLAHEFNTSRFVRLLVQPKGVRAPEYQTIGNEHKGFGAKDGEIAVSPDGNRLGLVTGNGIVELFHFDRCSGVLSRPIRLSSDMISGEAANDGQSAYYGCSFSPGGRCFYYSTLERLFQVDLTARKVTLTTRLVWADTVAFEHALAQHEAGPDGRLYFARYNSDYLAAIEEPDSRTCTINLNFLALPGVTVKAGLPNAPQEAIGMSHATVEQLAGPDVTIQQGESATLGTEALPEARYVWKPIEGLSNAATSQPTARPQHTMTYTLMVQRLFEGRLCGERWDTVTVFVREVQATPQATTQETTPAVSTVFSGREDIRVTMYPNPANNLVWLNYEAPEGRHYLKLEVETVEGRSVYRSKLRDGSGLLEMNTSEWAPGVYVCRFHLGGAQVSVGKLIITR